MAAATSKLLAAMTNLHKELPLMQAISNRSKFEISPVPIEAEIESCYIILTRWDDREVLLSTDRATSTVPVIDLPAGQRAAAGFINAVQQRFGLSAVCRFEVPVDDLMAKSRCVVLEVPAGEEPSGPVAWQPVRTVDWNQIAPSLGRDILWRALAKATNYNTGREQANFVRSGWLNEVRFWVSMVLPDQGLRPTGAWKQFNIGPDFSLIRFECSGQAVWFKAVGEPNCREFSITQQLAQLRLPHLAPLLAVHEAWHGWLMLDCGGNALETYATVDGWATAVRDLAQLQIASIGHGHLLMGSGARDMRPGVLAPRVDGFFEVMGDLMERQKKSSPPAVSRAELHDIQWRIKEALALVDKTSLPPTLGHLDLHPQNVLLSPVGAVFLDWAEAFFGYPFLSFQYLLEYFRRAFGQDHPQEERVTDHYWSRWREVVPEEDISRVRKVAPLLAAFGFAAASHARAKTEVPRTAAFLRSLTRRMGRESQLLTKGTCHVTVD
jgi:hypothetical protein